ncbi:tetratricopeptide repeat-containing sensor histidine kinase [Thalassobellus citreus]|uniref:tetratricopeptide repeat-containing sensor histidine kinase n=1 Tax=Thalassobellus citreus TaxID=3367752 RepID=UPI0037B12A46
MDFFLDIFVIMNFCLKAIIKDLLVLLFMLSGCFLFSQVEEEIESFNIEIKKKANEYSSYTHFYNASLFFIEKEWDSTLVCSMKHIDLAINNKELTDYSHYFRGYSFSKKELFKQAQKEFKLISREFEFHYLVKMKLAEIALEAYQFKEVISYYRELIDLPEQHYTYFKKSTVLHNLGISYLHLNKFKQAEPYLVEALRYEEQQKDTLGIISAYGNLATLYYEQYKDDLAILYFERAYQLSIKIKDFHSKQLTAKNMAVVEENRKNFKAALVYRKEYEQWKDSLNNQNKIYEVAKLEKEFAVKQKQKEVSLLQAENKAKIVERDGLLYSVITLLILLAVTFYFYKEKQQANKIIVAQKEGLDELNATKDKLFSIVSHDLRSSVNALKTSNTKLLDNLEEKNLEALDVLLHNNSAIVNGAYNLLDNLLNWALLQTKQSYFEITSIRLFFIVEQMAYNYKPLMLDKSIDFESTVLKKDVVFADQESLKIILRNLLDNAIKFSNPHGTIKIYTQNENETYCDLVIEDSGLGMSEAIRKNLLEESSLLSKKENENIEGTGLGLQLCKSLIKKNNGKFSIESELGKGTKMIVSLPKTTLNG